jgi:hypothetical protein
MTLTAYLTLYPEACEAVRADLLRLAREGVRLW